MYIDVLVQNHVFTAKDAHDVNILPVCKQKLHTT